MAELERTREYPVPAPELVRILSSRDYYETRHAWSGISNWHFDAFGETDGGFLIRLHRPLEIRSDRIPSFARALLPRSTTLVTELLWRQTEREPFEGRYRFSLTGVPVEVLGHMKVLGGENGARQRIRLEIDSRVPLIGGRIAALVTSGVDRALESDHRATLRYIDESNPQEAPRQG